LADGVVEITGHPAEDHRQEAGPAEGDGGHEDEDDACETPRLTGHV
jgi:hypothetical protein